MPSIKPFQLNQRRVGSRMSYLILTSCIRNGRPVSRMSCLILRSCIRSGGPVSRISFLILASCIRSRGPVSRMSFLILTSCIRNGRPVSRMSLLISSSYIRIILHINKRVCTISTDSFVQPTHLKGIEPPHMVPETTALSTELQVHLLLCQLYAQFFLILKEKLTFSTWD